MDFYLSRVKKTDERGKKSPVIEEKVVKEDSEEFREEEKDYMAGRKSFFQKFMDFIAGTEDDMPKETEIEEKADEKELERYEKKNTGFLNYVKNLFSGREEKPDEEIVEHTEKPKEVPEDIKEVLRLQNKWLMMLPGRTIREFKVSEDYRTYKETLEKYGLIKTK